jgi:hypothetical protein
MSDKAHMHGDGESRSGVVPTKQPNKSERSPAEAVGGKAVGQGEHEPTQPVPDSESGKLVKRAGSCARSSKEG